jgi:hypothetical protein
LEQGTVEQVGPFIVEVDEGLEGAQARVVEPALETSLVPFGLFDLEHLRQPGLTGDLPCASEKTVEIQPLQALLERLSSGARHHWSRLGIHWMAPVRVVRNR